MKKTTGKPSAKRPVPSFAKPTPATVKPATPPVPRTAIATTMANQKGDLAALVAANRAKQAPAPTVKDPRDVKIAELASKLNEALSALKAAQAAGKEADSLRAKLDASVKATSEARLVANVCSVPEPDPLGFGISADDPRLDWIGVVASIQAGSADRDGVWRATKGIGARPMLLSLPVPALDRKHGATALSAGLLAAWDCEQNGDTYAVVGDPHYHTMSDLEAAIQADPEPFRMPLGD